MKVGITGHQRLEDAASWQWVKPQIDKILLHLPKPIIGISSLAAGADQMFAQSILQHGGSLNVVVPFKEYENTFKEEQEREKYLELLKIASQVDILPRASSDEESYYKAGKRVAEASDIIVAVWDGEPAAGLGGTGDIVKYAIGLSKRIIHINPLNQTITQVN